MSRVRVWPGSLGAVRRRSVMCSVLGTATLGVAVTPGTATAFTTGMRPEPAGITRAIGKASRSTSVRPTSAFGTSSTTSTAFPCGTDARL